MEREGELYNKRLKSASLENITKVKLMKALIGNVEDELTTCRYTQSGKKQDVELS